MKKVVKRFDYQFVLHVYAFTRLKINKLRSTGAVTLPLLT